MYQGMAYLELFYNKACTKKIEQDINGNYTLATNVVSSNAYDPYITTFYVKNNGSHAAYDCNITAISNPNSMTIDTTVINNLTLLSGEVRRCLVSVPITRSETGTKTITLNVAYDSI